ncbi:hypothetical protein ACE1B6_05320 [Aerosakkonemataceae cyanobacterium BLCC-F154]|uniref:Uncharacterized protein n=1 Tax=Floridaenema fluviatile BLCC-F154 TaxID=3153640 RepID=A0ABV4Y9A8_9CYAN
MDHQPPVHRRDTPIKINGKGSRLQQSQDIIYGFLLKIVRQWPPEMVLQEFKNLFIYQSEVAKQEVIQAVYKIVFENDETEFRNTLKRSCYILINNWDATRRRKSIQDLIEAFNEPKIHEETISQNLNRIRYWLINFIKSKDYQELKLFASRFDTEGHWAHRYTCYLLVPQYMDLRNPEEQRAAARALSKELKDKFKFDLAMYTAYTQSTASNHRKLTNPTGLGDEVLRLIKRILVKRGPFSYTSLANIFMKQTQNMNYKFYKKSLSNYLLFSVKNPRVVNIFNQNLSAKLDTIYADRDEEILNQALVLRSCNRVIDFLTTENREDPAELFVLLLSQGNPLTLVVVLLKIILVSPNSRSHLETCVAILIDYYQKYPEAECQWVIYFLELFNITFAIYAENVEYNLVNMRETKVNNPGSDRNWNWDTWRIFSQLKQENKIPSYLLDEQQLEEELNKEELPTEG